MRITLKGFAGKAPRVDPLLLPDNAAQTATNTKLWRGTVQPFRNYSTIVGQTKAGTITSIYRFGKAAPETQYWFHWTTDVNAVRGPVAGDTTERTYFTGDGVPKVTDNARATLGGGTAYPINSYTLGVPKPANTPIATAPATPATGSDTAESRVYIYTYVSEWGEEGKPSTASNLVSAKIGDTITLTGLSTVPTGSYNMANGTKRIYRAATGNESTAYRFVAEIPVAQTSYNDAVATTSLGETLTSLYYDVPPTAMVGMMALPNASLAGFSGNEVCFSEPGLPHAWPAKYRMTTETDIVGLGSFGTTLVVLTTSVPYVATGVDPASMSMQKMELQQACVSKRSIVNTGDTVLYASPDGLVAVGTGGASVITQSIFTRDDWQALKPSSISAYFHDGRYIAFYDTGTQTGGFVIDPAQKQFYDLGFYATAGFNDLVNDSLFLMVGSNIVKFEGSGTNLTFIWKSKKFMLPKHVNFSAALVQANSYSSLSAKFYADGALKHTQTVTNANPFRLPSGFLSKVWEFEISGTDAVSEMYIATSVAELKDV
jgi:hypothetical protein